MELKIIITTLILLFLLFMGIYFVIIGLFINDAKNKFTKIEKITKEMKISILDQKLISIEIEKINLNSNRLKELKEEIFYLKKQNELKIIKKIFLIKKQFKKWYYFNPYIFNNKLNKYRIVVFEQYLFYLNIAFSLNEYLLDQEINSNIINTIKNQFGECTKLFNNSKFPKVKTSKFLNSEIGMINQKIKNLIVEMQISSLSNDAKEMIKKIVVEINTFKNNLAFFESSFTFWQLTLSREINNLKYSILENKDALKNNKKYIFEEIKNLNSLKEKIINDEFQFEIILVNEAIEQSKSKIIEWKLEINLNLDSYNLLLNYIKKTNEIIDKFWIDKENLFKYRNYLDSSSKIINLSKMKKLSILLENTQNDFLSLINNFKMLNSSITAYELFEKFSDLIIFFKNNIQEMLKNQKAINVIIKSTDVVNELVAEINTTLLNSEYDLNTLPVKIKTNYAMQLDEYQSKLEQLMNYFQKSVRFVDNDKVMLVKEILANAIKLQQEIKRAAFIRFYNENLIVELNKFNNNTSIYLSFINLIEEAYHIGDQTEVLRLSKKLVENLNIHE